MDFDALSRAGGERERHEQLARAGWDDRLTKEQAREGQLVRYVGMGFFLSGDHKDIKQIPVEERVHNALAVSAAVFRIEKVEGDKIAIAPATAADGQILADAGLDRMTCCSHCKPGQWHITSPEFYKQYNADWVNYPIWEKVGAVSEERQRERRDAIARDAGHGRERERISETELERRLGDLSRAPRLDRREAEETLGPLFGDPTPSAVLGLTTFFSDRIRNVADSMLAPISEVRQECISKAKSLTRERCLKLIADLEEAERTVTGRIRAAIAELKATLAGMDDGRKKGREI